MRKNYLMLIPALAMLLSGCGKDGLNQRNTLEPDNIEYEEPLVVDFNKPNVVSLAPKKAAVSASGISLHYHNEDGQCAKRAFWIWCAGVNGSQFAPTKISNDGKDMEVSFSFTDEHASFANKKGISFIVKFADSWAGQSENVEILYSEHVPDASGVTTLWIIPGEGDAVEVYDRQEDTKMDRVQLATFTNWKTIKVISTAAPSSYKLYALTSNYMSMASTATADILQRYLIKEGTNPSCTDTTYNSIPSKQFEINLNFTAKVNVQYYLEAIFPNYPTFTKTKYVSFTDLYETERFKTYYTYSGDDLGVTYISKTETKFKVWAPTAARIRVLIYESGSSTDYAKYDPMATDDAVGYNMVFQPGGVWEVTIQNKDLNGMYYQYYVVNSLGINTVVDPYAKACGIDGKRGMIVNWNETNPDGWENVPAKWDGVDGYDIKTPNELSVYETHIRDLTMDESWNGKKMRGTYSAFIERGTTVTKDDVTVKTGFDHIEELGVKAVQLEPVFDSDNVEATDSRSYNWGYNPLNYNCVDGSYATNPYYGQMRVKEFKSLVQAFATNANKTRVIMDVVYNHVASAPSSNFHKLMPRYYFRYTEEGNYYNGSGCGNDVKTEAPMMSKFIVDSLCFWAKEYKIKGFRFDLMGLINVGTIDAARKALYKIDPDIVIYGEGWTGDGTGFDYETREIYSVHGQEVFHDNPNDPKALPQEKINLLGCVTAAVYRYLYPIPNTCYVGGFNDSGRNALRGDNNLDNGWGFIDQGAEHVGDKSVVVADMMVGYHSGMGGNPNQCVNYASCHDNYTLFDQVSFGISGSASDVGLACAAVSAVECAIMFSNGIAFIHGGEEVFRTKEVKTPEDLELAEAVGTINGKTISHNSYNLSDDVNAYRWDRKISIGSVSTKEYVEEIAKAVKTRNSLKKYSYDDLANANPYDSHSPMNVWNQGNGSTCIAMRNENHFFFLAGCNNNDIRFGDYDGLDTGTKYNKLVFCSNPKAGGFSHPSSGYIKLGWYTCVCLTK